MTRKEKRAVKFNPFSIKRFLYIKSPKLVGIGKEMDDAWDEYCTLSKESDLDLVWGGSFSNPDYYEFN